MLLTESAPLLLFADPTALPQCTPWQLCEAGNLGSTESNVMAGRALLGCLQLPAGQNRHAIFLVLDKAMQGSNKTAAHRVYRRIAPRSIEVVLLPQFVARTFCGRLIDQYAKHTDYFDPCHDWPHPNRVEWEHSSGLTATDLSGRHKKPPRAISLCAG